jgi:hypothetical protein
MFGRRWGKNVLGIDEAMTAAIQGQRVGWFEPTYKYLLEAWRELEHRLRPGARSVSEQEKRIELLNGGLVEAWTCDNPDPARSRAYHLAIINEAGLIRGLRSIWQESIRPALTDYQGRALFLGTPKGRTHDYSVIHAHADGTPDWEAFRGPTTENPFIDKAEVEGARRDMPPQAFAQEYEGIPADDGGNPFGLDAIGGCTVPSLVTGAGPLCFGWDFARAQDWTVGIGLSADYEVVRFHRWQLIPWGVQKAQVHELSGATPCWGDSTGVGDAVVEDLQKMGVPMIGVTFSKPVKQKLMERLAVCIQQRKLRFPEGPIRSELDTFSYEYTAHGVRYKAPDGMHDDCVMALALAVYGRDQFGEVPEVLNPVAFEEDRHPGFDVETKKRRKPWASGEPVVPRWTPSKQLEPL